MDVKLKQRLVGAAVVVSLGVIFLPMLLDGGRYTDLEKIRIEIPDPPRHEFSSTIAPVSPPVSKPPVSKPVAEKITPVPADEIDKQGAAPVIDDEIARIIEPIKAPKEVAPQEVSNKKPETAVSKPVTAKKPGVAKTGQSKPKPATKPVTQPASPVSQTTASLVSAWVIQVGSFDSRDNALSLRNNLRKQGFTSFVESFDKDGKSSHRVRIGPEVNRSRAEQTLLRLRKKMSLSGIIVSYP